MSKDNKPRILIIDGKSNWRDAIATVLENEFEVEKCGDFKDALVKTQNQVFDLIILDLHLGGEDFSMSVGILLLRKIREQLSKLPVILLSRYDEDLRPELISKYDPVLVIKKPLLNINEFLKCVRVSTRNHRFASALSKLKNFGKWLVLQRNY